MRIPDRTILAIVTSEYNEERVFSTKYAARYGILLVRLSSE
jgi:hypothetical protein